MSVVGQRGYPGIAKLANHFGMKSWVGVEGLGARAQYRAQPSVTPNSHPTSQRMINLIELIENYN